MHLRYHALLVVPLVIWLLMFQFAGVIPNEKRPHIDVTTLPTLERILFGDALLYRLFPGTVFFAFLAAIPYLAHFSLPFILSIYLWKIDKRPTLFLWYFGLMNATAVATQLILPTAPPWYNARYGFDPANYELPGDPGRLKIVDDLLGVEIFQGIYGTSPLVFGSWPSLHAAWPFMISLYTSMFSVPFPRFKWVYCGWIWWAAVWTRHHFLLDVLGGMFYCCLSVTITALLVRKGFFGFLFDSPTDKTDIRSVV